MTKERGRESKREEETGKELLMGCFCVKKGAFPNLALDETLLSTLGQEKTRTLIKLVSKKASLSFTHAHTLKHTVGKQ